jgi:hypothetical protein
VKLKEFLVSWIFHQPAAKSHAGDAPAGHEDQESRYHVDNTKDKYQPGGKYRVKNIHMTSSTG